MKVSRSRYWNLNAFRKGNSFVASYISRMIRIPCSDDPMWLFAISRMNSGCSGEKVIHRLLRVVNSFYSLVPAERPQDRLTKIGFYRKSQLASGTGDVGNVPLRR